MRPWTRQRLRTRRCILPSWQEALDLCLWDVVRADVKVIPTLKVIRATFDAWDEEWQGFNSSGAPAYLKWAKQNAYENWKIIGQACFLAARKIKPSLSLDDVAELMISKQRDYGHQNILRFREAGLFVRMHDKLARLENLTSKEASAKNEPILDSWIDLVGYSLIGMMLANDTFELELADEPAVA